MHKKKLIATGLASLISFYLILVTRFIYSDLLAEELFLALLTISVICHLIFIYLLTIEVTVIEAFKRWSFSSIVLDGLVILWSIIVTWVGGGGEAGMIFFVTIPGMLIINAFTFLEALISPKWFNWKYPGIWKKAAVVGTGIGVLSYLWMVLLGGFTKVRVGKSAGILSYFVEEALPPFWNIIICFYNLCFDRKLYWSCNR